MPAKYFDIHYRKASAIPAGATSLEDAVKSALSRADALIQPLWLRAEDRIMDMADHSDAEKLLFNTPADVAKGIAGELCLYRQGAVQPILAFEPKTVKTSSISVAQIFALIEQEAPEKREFITGVCYWLVIENHVLFVTLRGFPKDYVRDFFAWLTASGSSDSPVLTAELDPAEVAGNLGRISKFVVRGSNGKPKFAVTPADSEGQLRVRKGRLAVPWDKAEDAIALTIGESALTRLKDSLTDKNRLFAETEWGVIGPRSKKLKETLSALASEAANSTDGEVSVMGKDGEIKDGSAILKLRMPFNVERDGHYLLDFAEAVGQLNEAFRRFSSDGKLVT
jgi:hypothetical protein